MRISDWSSDVCSSDLSGKDVGRPQLAAMLSFIREGDTPVVHSMDRLARNLGDLRKLVPWLTRQGISIEFVKESLSFTGEDSPMAKDERRGGQECVSTCRSRWSKSQDKKNKKKK